MKKLVIFAAVFIFSVPELAKAKWSISPHIAIAVPRSDFVNVSGVGGGFGIRVIRDLSGREGGFGLRGDFDFLSHGREPTFVNIGFASFFAEIRRQSFRLTFGTQYSGGSRKFKFYGGVTGGFYFFRTSITDRNSGVDFDANSDAAVGWNLGAGLLYDIGWGPWLDLSLEYQTIYNITTEFEVNGQLEKQDITANEFTIKAGVIFFLK